MSTFFLFYAIIYVMENGRTNYTKKIREDCQRHNDTLYDVSTLRNSEFADVPYKTLLKILNRLEGEGVVRHVSRGVYYIGEKTITDELILSEYTDDGRGMLVGYTLFNNIGLSSYEDDRVEIYTNAIGAQHKTIGKFDLKYVDLNFEDEIIDLVSLLEILNAEYGIKDCYFEVYTKIVEILTQSYSDEVFKKVISAIRYKYSTIERLSDLLERNKTLNYCIEIYQE